MKFLFFWKALVASSGTAQARTTTTEWHPVFRQPIRIAVPHRIITLTYDDFGNVITKAYQATTDAAGAQNFSGATVGKAQTWAYTYNTLGQRSAVTGPRAEVTRYACDDAGNLTSATSPAGRVTTLSNYDANGRAGTLQTSNGQTTLLAYTLRGWLSAKTVTANGAQEVTSYEYDGAGLLLRKSLPGGDAINYVYDGAHRLIAATDGAGNNVAYDLDNLGNHWQKMCKAPGASQSARVRRSTMHLVGFNSGVSVCSAVVNTATN